NPLILRLNNGPYARQTQRGGALNVTYRADFGAVPVIFKWGFKNQRAEWLYRDETDLDRYKYVGTLPMAQLLAQIQSRNQVSFADSGISIRTRNGSTDLYLPSDYKLLQLYREHPEYWTQTTATTPTEWYGVHVGNNRQFSEETNALYAMATSEPL